MRWQKPLLLTTAALLALAAAAPTCLAQMQPQPELLVRLWPFFRSTRPVPLLPDDQVEPSEEGERKPLVAPFPRRKLNINNASFFQLQNLSGIDSSMAARIMAGRPYATPNDLLRDGIPLNVVQRLKDEVEFGP